MTRGELEAEIRRHLATRLGPANTTWTATAADNTFTAAILAACDAYAAAKPAAAGDDDARVEP